MTNDDHFNGKSGQRYRYADLARLISEKAPETLGKHISVQLAALGLLAEMEGGITPCGLPFTFAVKPQVNHINDLFTAIAREHLGIATLETRNRDALDFHEVSIWGIKRALRAAYEAGENNRPTASDTTEGD